MCCVMGYTGHDLSAAKFKEYLLRTVMRGPDDQRVVEGPFGLMGFGRLAIMGLTPEGMQPFYRGADCVVCNGELYGFRFEKEILKRRGYKFASDCDCEILLPLYYEYGLDMFRHMDSEFALILYDSRKDRLIAARDPIGIRPLFYGYSKSSHQIAFASEMQNLIGWCDDIRPFPIGSYYCDGRFVRYEDIADVPAPMEDDMPTILKNIREKLIAGVEKRLDADAPVGFLLSGGLDSSLVCSIAAKKLGKPIRTFAIGMDLAPIDLKYAREVADFIGAEHTEVIISEKDVLVGIAASGRTPYVLGAMNYARQQGAHVIGISCNPGSQVEKTAEIAITPTPGPEVVTGSTRMKSGTAQKMVLNMLSTGAMIKLGKVYGNLMVDVKPTNAKLVERCKRIVCEATGVDYDTATEALEKCGYRAKVAIVMLKTGSDVHEAEQRLEAHEGRVAQAVGEN